MIDRIRSLIKQRVVRDIEVLPEQLLDQDLDLDLLDLIDIRDGLDEELGIDIPDSSIDRWLTIQDVIDTAEGLSE